MHADAAWGRALEPWHAQVHLQRLQLGLGACNLGFISMQSVNEAACNAHLQRLQLGLGGGARGDRLGRRGRVRLLLEPLDVSRGLDGARRREGPRLCKGR